MVSNLMQDHHGPLHDGHVLRPPRQTAQGLAFADAEFSHP